jgi:hypothetical protein
MVKRRREGDIHLKKRKGEIKKKIMRITTMKKVNIKIMMM